MTAEPEPEMGHLVIQDLAKSYKVKRNREEHSLEVFANIDLAIERSEFYCIIGPTGCGKSTLLRIVAGLIAPSGGRVMIEDREVTGPRPEVALVFQNYNLLPWRTALQNVELGMESRKISTKERRSRAEHWLNVVGLEKFSSFYPGQMSGGMQQRVGLARALAVEPDILLMDEPFGSVDAQTRRLLQAELMRLHEVDQKTVLFVTHDVEEAVFLGDRVAVLAKGVRGIVETVDVPFGRPRDDRIHADSRFVRLREQLWDLLIEGEGTSPGLP